MRPKKRWGQHFLIRPEIAGRIAGFAGLGPADTVVEIGAGAGILTEELAKRAGRVIAFEIDRDLVTELEEKFASSPNVDIVAGDFMKVGPERLKRLAKFRVVANIPYYLTTPLIFLLLELLPAMELAVLTIQKEVAQRLAAGPGTKTYGALTLSVGLMARVELVLTVKKGAFRPPPKVDSAVVRISPRPQPLLGAGEVRPFLALVHAAFGQRRKTMLNRLSNHLELSKDRARLLLTENGIDPARRPETLSLEEFARLARAVGKN